MGSSKRNLLLGVVALLSFCGIVAAIGQRSSNHDVVAAAITVDDGPESLAFDSSEGVPESPIGDDATWMPVAPSSSDDETAALGDRASAVASSDADVSGSTTLAAPQTTTDSSGSGTGTPSTTVTGGSIAAPVATTRGNTGQPSTTQPTGTQPTGTQSTAVQPTAVQPNNQPPASTTAAAPPVSRPPVVGFVGIDVADFTNSNVNISQNGQDGSFRTACTVSHFNFDDAIVFPGQRAATHLHMYFGNTLADFSSTGGSLAASGDATCQGGPLNRSSYWVPAVLDQNGEVRPAQYMLAYYKRAGDEDVVPYPNGLQMVAGNAMAMAPQPGREQPIGAGVDYAWSCGSPITVGKHDVGRLIPDCSPGEFLTLSLIFPRCGDGRLESSDNKSHMAYPAFYGGPCPLSHPVRHPQLTYNIHWNNNDTNTGDWYLSSDDHRANGGMLMPGGTTTHADWIGAWHPDVLEIMTSGCFNADHDCKGGTISPSLRLDAPSIQGYSPSNIYNAGVAPTVLPFSSFAR